MMSSEFELDLSRLSQDELLQVAQTRGLPKNIRTSAGTLYFLGERTHYRSNQDERGGSLSEKWTKNTSPRTLGKIRRLLGKDEG